MGRGASARMLAEALGPRHIDLSGLTVPTLVIGSEKDRLLPIVSSRRIADAAPNLARFVELPGGHCAILEHPHDVNHQLRKLAESVTAARRAIS
jgi:pimeloyl-ACP methyl ester carboxylesterase